MSVWTAPAKRSVDGAFIAYKAAILHSLSFCSSKLVQKPKRCRAGDRRPPHAPHSKEHGSLCFLPFPRLTDPLRCMCQTDDQIPTLSHASEL